jgi:hypothetical protein
MRMRPLKNLLRNPRSLLQLPPREEKARRNEPLIFQRLENYQNILF